MPKKKVIKEVQPTMEITAKRLKQVLDLVKPAVAAGGRIPITQHVAFANKQAHAINLECYLTVSVPELNGDSFTVSHKALSDMTKFFPADSKIGMFYKKPTLQLISGSKESSLGATMEYSEFIPAPTLNEPLEYVLDGDELVEVLTQTGVSASKEESRPILTGLQIHLGCNENQVAAADSFRLSVHSLKNLVRCEQPAIFTLPVKTAEILAKVWKLEKPESREITLTLSQMPPIKPAPPEAPPLCYIHKSAFTERRVVGDEPTRWTHLIDADLVEPNDPPDVCVQGLGFYPAPYGELAPVPKEPETPKALTRFAGALFSFGDVTLHSQLLEGTFPNYAALIPSVYSGCCLFDAEQFQAALNGMLGVAKEGSGIIRLELAPGKLVMSCRAEEVGDMKDSLDAVVKLFEPIRAVDSPGPPIVFGRVAFNAKYLLDYINKRKGEVEMRISSPSSPGLFLHERAPEQQVLMPMFVTW